MARLRRYGVVALLVVVTALFVAGCSPKTTMAPPVTTPAAGGGSASSTPGATGAHQLVVITAKGFSPASVTVKAGTNVIWSNSDKSPHSVVLGAGATSGEIKPKGSASHVFDKEGTYKYKDGLNPDLGGTVTVE